MPRNVGFDEVAHGAVLKTVDLMEIRTMSARDRSFKTLLTIVLIAILVGIALWYREQQCDPHPQFYLSGTPADCRYQRKGIFQAQSSSASRAPRDYGSKGRMNYGYAN